jgi:hypothetical protein
MGLTDAGGRKVTTELPHLHSHPDLWKTIEKLVLITFA